MSAWAVGVVVVAAVAAGAAWLGRRLGLAAAADDPRRDPAARWVGADRAEALEHLLRQAEPLGAAAVVERALELCAVHERLSWRAGLRRVVPLAQGLPDDADGGALRAELWAALGELARAREALEAVPADHWRACAVRARLYEIDGDVERADSAWVAAFVLAPADRRAPVGRHRDALRARHGREPNEPLRLWDRPPDG